MESAHGASERSSVQWDDLLQHRGFVRRLARGLVRDEARAEDLEQEAWRRALEHPPHEAGAARSWFGTVLRRLAGRAAREEGRRTRREHAVARPERLPPTPDVEGRLRLERELVQAVEALREPYRSTVFLRYFEDLSPRAIAARQEVPVATVKTRLRRGLELLRGTLDGKRERRDWALGLLRVAGAGGPSALSLGAGTALGIAGSAALLVLVARSQGTFRQTSEPQGASTLAPLASVAAGPLPLLQAPAHLSRRPAAAVHEEAAPAPTPSGTEAVEEPRASAPETALVWRGRVLFPDGGPVAGADVALGTQRTRTDASGGFALAIEPADPLRRSLFGGMEKDTALVAWCDAWVPAVLEQAGARVLDARRGSGPLEDVELVLPERALEIRGLIVDRQGHAAEGWRVSLLDGTLVHRGAYRPFSAEELASGVDSHVEVRDGSFTFGGLVPGRSYRVRAWNPSTLEQVESEPLLAGTRNAILHAPADPWRPGVDGVVVGLDGSPLEGVRCRLSMNEYRLEGSSWGNTGQEVQTDASGRFAFHDVPRCELFIRFNLGAAAAQRDLPPEDPGRDLRVEIVRAGAFRIESLPAGIDAVAVQNADGEELRIELELGGGRTTGTRRLEVAADGTAEGRVSELARWLVLFEKDREIGRRPLIIRPGELVPARW